MKRSDATDRHRKDLRSLEPDSEEYWNEILRREGLSMSAGNDRRLCHEGSGTDLARIESARTANSLTGGGKKVSPKGAKPE